MRHPSGDANKINEVRIYYYTNMCEAAAAAFKFPAVVQKGNKLTRSNNQAGRQ